MNAGQYSGKGIKPTNEDACGIRIPDEPLLTTKGIVAVIADGVSNSVAGHEASEACVRGILSDYYSTPESWGVKTSGQRILGALNRWLHGQGCRRYNSESGMVTTLSAVIIKSATAHLFHIGDTRIYLLRDGALECLTQDHKLWAESEKAFLSRAMGAGLNVEIDYRSIPVETGDIFLLTTDGVHDFLTNRDLQGLLIDHDTNMERRCNAIITRALEQGSRDNVTCQVLKIEDLSHKNEDEFYQHLTELPFPPPLHEGMILDGYRILHEIHSSKRTQIYLAIDSDSGEKVVIKTPSVNFEDDPVYIDNFLHEEWAGKRINNPHVLKVLTPKRRRFLYYVTEYLQGQTLRQWMNDHPCPALMEVRAIVKQITVGIRAFHRLEMIHQDIKPENIMIDHQGIVKIVDFGSTRIAGIQEISAPIERNNPGGTVDYAAPECLEGYEGTAYSDLYSLGVIAYEMLTGKLPYGKPLTLRNLQHARYIPAKQYNPDIPAWVDGALKKAVKKDPRHRYPALSEFVYDLSHPNTHLVGTETLPLLEKNPIAFWQGLSLILLLLNILLLYLLSH